MESAAVLDVCRWVVAFWCGGVFFIFLNDKNDKKQEDLLISSHGLHLLSSGHTGGPSAHVYIHHSGIQCCQQCVGLWKHFHYPFLIKLQSHMPFSYRITSADCNLFFFQLTLPGNVLFFERILKLEIKHLMYLCRIWFNFNF